MDERRARVRDHEETVVGPEADPVRVARAAEDADGLDVAAEARAVVDEHAVRVVVRDGELAPVPASARPSGMSSQRRTTSSPSTSRPLASNVCRVTVWA